MVCKGFLEEELQTRLGVKTQFLTHLIAGIPRDGDTLTELYIHTTERQGKFELIPCVECVSLVVLNVNGDDAESGQLGKFDDTKIQMMTWSSWSIGSDADVVACLGMFGERNQGFCTASGTGPPGGIQTELGAGLGNDITVLAWAGQDDCLAGREHAFPKPGHQKHGVVPERPDEFLGIFGIDLGKILQAHVERVANGTHETGDERTGFLNSDFCHW